MFKEPTDLDERQRAGEDDDEDSQHQSVRHARLGCKRSTLIGLCQPRDYAMRYYIPHFTAQKTKAQRG